MGSQRMRALGAAFPRTLPVMAGYLFLGLAWGIVLREKGFGPEWALLISAAVYAGSMQFAMLGLMTAPFSPGTTVMMTLLVNARHLFYGLTMLEPYGKVKRGKPYLIFSLTDETYSLLCSLKVPDGMDEKKVMFLISLLDQIYWIIGSVVGAALGQVLPLDMTGIDFAMTALFVTIFVDQWREAKSHLPAVMGLISSVICLQIFGGSNFILTSLIITVTILMALQKRLEGKVENT